MDVGTFSVSGGSDVGILILDSQYWVLVVGIQFASSSSIKRLVSRPRNNVHNWDMSKAFCERPQNAHGASQMALDWDHRSI
jgi:hypothetical protein